MRRIRWLVIICIVLLLVYAASPYVAFWHFTVALRSGDAAALNARVDFPAVRQSLKAQLVAYFSPDKTGERHIKNKRLAGLVTALRPTLVDALVDAYVTPDGLAALIVDPNAVKRMRAPQSAQQSHAFKSVDWSKVRYAFFTSPRVFVVDREGIKLRFRFTGFGWRLNKLDLGLSDLKK
jgi:Protein of unknown function (DUF2939)